jgi:hypothetical protein
MRKIYLSIIESRYIDPKMCRFLEVRLVGLLNLPVPLVRSVATFTKKDIITIWETSSIGYEIMPENHSLDGGRNVTSKNSTKIWPVTLQTKSTKHIHKIHISTRR